MKFKIVFVVWIFSIFTIEAKQDSNSKFDSIYYKTAVEIAGSDPDRGLFIADSLYRGSDSGLLKLRSLMLAANIYQGKNNQVASIKRALQAYDYSVKEKNHKWQVLILGFLSTQYRNIGLNEHGRKYIELALKANDKITEPLVKSMQLALIEQELAYYALLNKTYEKVIEHIGNSNRYLGQVPDSPNHLYHLTASEELLGRGYLGLKDYDKALVSFSNALDFLEDFQQEKGVLSSYVYMGIAESYVGLEKDSLALEYFKKAEPYALSSEYLNLELALYKNFVDFFTRHKDWESLDLYSSKLEQVSKKDKELKRQAIETVFNISQQEIENSQKKATFYLALGTLLFIVAMVCIVLYRRKNKRAFEKYQEIVNLMQQNNKETTSGNMHLKSKDAGADKPVEEVDTKRRMSYEIELQILNYLKQFESDLEFLKPSISLSTLASYCQTNTKYVSYVLNQKIGKDFNSYINELRVKYIIYKLKNEPIYRSYKISYLAELGGFSSHSKFTAVFKEITDLAPSVFIQYLKDEK